MPKEMIIFLYATLILLEHNLYKGNSYQIFHTISFHVKFAFHLPLSLLLKVNISNFCKGVVMIFIIPMHTILVKLHFLLIYPAANCSTQLAITYDVPDIKLELRRTILHGYT